MNLDNRTAEITAMQEGESCMGKQTKIRRRVSIGGELRWVCANSEQEYAQKCAQQMAQAVPIPQTRKTRHNFREYAENWFKTFARPNVADVTAITYERQIRLHLCPVLGEYNIEDLTTTQVQEVFNRMGDKTKATKNKARIVLNMILGYAVEEGLLLRNPMQSKSVRVQGGRSKTRPPYEPQQMQTLVKGIPRVQNPQDRAFLALIALHPLRLEEVLGLKGADIDREACKLHVENAVTHPDRNRPIVKCLKTSESERTLDIVPQILQYIPDAAADNFIIGGETPLSYQRVRLMCNRIQRDIGFTEKIVPSRFRPTVPSDLYDQTKDLKQVQRAAGHSNTNTTIKHYLHSRSENQNTAQPIAQAYGL